VHNLNVSAQFWRRGVSCQLELEAGGYAVYVGNFQNLIRNRANTPVFNKWIFFGGIGIVPNQILLGCRLTRDLDITTTKEARCSTLSQAAGIANALAMSLYLPVLGADIVFQTFA